MKASVLNAVLLLGGLLVITTSVLVGPTSLSLAASLQALLGTGPESAQIIVQDIRLPRALSAYLVGAMLGLSGAALQGLLRNPLAEPGVLGVSASSSLFATFSIYYGLSAFS